jgi:hypothetical protein
LVSVVIVPEFDRPAPPAPLLEPPFPPPIIPLLLSVVIVPAFDTPAPPGALVPPFPPMIVAPIALMSVAIDSPAAVKIPTPPAILGPPNPPSIPPLFESVVIEAERASTLSPPFVLPMIFPLFVTVIAAPLLKIGPLTVVEMVWLLMMSLLKKWALAHIW